jgi:hypothetical protein
LLAGLGPLEDSDATLALASGARLAHAERAEVGAAPSGGRLTRAGAILGTEGYMSPEQAAGGEADERSDQFCFCASLYEALYAVPPFPGADGLEEYARRVLSTRARVPPPSDVPIVVERAILRGLEREPAARFPSMRELITALASGLGTSSEPLLRRRDKIRLTLALIVGITMVELANVVIVSITHSSNSLVRSIAVATVLLCVTGALWRWPAWPERHAQRYRGLLAYLSITLASMILGRVAALAVGTPPNDYYVVECVMLAALCVTESLRVGARHALLALLPLAYAPLIVLLPELRLLLHNIVLVTVFLCSLFLHMRQADADEPSGAPPPSQRSSTVRSDARKL